jgi:hypothetical protein
VHVDDIGAEPLACDFKRQERARTVLEESVNLGEASEPLVRGGMAAVRVDPRLCFVEQERDLVWLKPVDAGEMPAPPSMRAAGR